MIHPINNPHVTVFTFQYKLSHPRALVDFIIPMIVIIFIIIVIVFIAVVVIVIVIIATVIIIVVVVIIFIVSTAFNIHSSKLSYRSYGFSRETENNTSPRLLPLTGR